MRWTNDSTIFPANERRERFADRISDPDQLQAGECVAVCAAPFAPVHRVMPYSTSFDAAVRRRGLARRWPSEDELLEHALTAPLGAVGELEARVAQRLHVEMQRVVAIDVGEALEVESDVELATVAAVAPLRMAVADPGHVELEAGLELDADRAGAVRGGARLARFGGWAERDPRRRGVAARRPQRELGAGLREGRARRSSPRAAPSRRTASKARPSPSSLRWNRVTRSSKLSGAHSQ